MAYLVYFLLFERNFTWVIDILWLHLQVHLVTYSVQILTLIDLFCTKDLFDGLISSHTSPFRPKFYVQPLHNLVCTIFYGLFYIFILLGEPYLSMSDIL